MSDILEISHLNKNFKSFALQDVSFALPQGFIMGFIGPNGAGKTTTIKMILNMLRRQSGDIRLFGLDSLADEQAVKQRIGIVMDQPFYVEDWQLTTVERAIAPFYPSWDHQRFTKLLGDFSLDPAKKVKELSRGMKMKLMITVALSYNAELLILDEPTSGLDPVARNELMEILGEFMQDERKGILFSTHITSDLEKIADYITFIRDGRIVFTGQKDDLLEQYLMVKGGPEEMTAELRQMLAGCREHSTGFEGLINTANIRRLPSGILTEQASLDEIIICLNKEDN